MAEKTNHITWKIGGEAGFGIMSVGDMFARICMRAGLHVFTYSEFPSLIRGGHNTMQVTASTDPVPAHLTDVHLLVALNRESINLHLTEVDPHAIILYDTSDISFKDFQPTEVKRRDVTLIGLPLEDLAQAGGGAKFMRNTVALGASCALLNIPTDHLAEVIHDMFAKKGDKIVTLNVNILMAGYKAITDKQAKSYPWSITPEKHPTDQVLLSGNDALSLGAIQAGCQLFSAYPMTPATSILHFLAEHGPTYGMVVRHAEDEIAAINHAIGAAFTGVRTLTATAGGGFSLMTEAVGMAAMTEVGIVVIEAQRGGPSTGLPTWTEQADLRQVLHASQGDFPRIVLAPSSHVECFTLIQEAFHLADLYQTPVIVMTDKYLAEGYRNVTLRDLKARSIERGKITTAIKGNPSELFHRYKMDVPDGIAPRTFPGTPAGLFLANSDEHDEAGYSNEEMSIRQGQMERRARKTETLKKDLIPPRLVGPKKVPLTVVTWGSSAGAVEAALSILQQSHKKEANAMIITMVAPFPTEAVQHHLNSAKKTVIVEANQSGQMAGWIRQHTGIVFDHAINRFDGRPFDPAELAKQLSKFL